jgi:hypothetical protein
VELLLQLTDIFFRLFFGLIQIEDVFGQNGVVLPKQVHLVADIRDVLLGIGRYTRNDLLHINAPLMVVHFECLILPEQHLRQPR